MESNGSALCSVQCQLADLLMNNGSAVPSANVSYPHTAISQCQTYNIPFLNHWHVHQWVGIYSVLKSAKNDYIVQRIFSAEKYVRYLCELYHYYYVPKICKIRYYFLLVVCTVYKFNYSCFLHRKFTCVTSSMKI